MDRTFKTSVLVTQKKLTPTLLLPLLVFIKELSLLSLSERMGLRLLEGMVSFSLSLDMILIKVYLLIAQHHHEFCVSARTNNSIQTSISHSVIQYFGIPQKK